MQHSTSFSILLAAISLAVPSYAGLLRGPSGMITLPMRHVQRNPHLPLELRHQREIIRAERLMARAAGRPGPSDAQLLETLERRMVDSGKWSPSDYPFGSGAVENDETSDQLAQFSSRVRPSDEIDASFVTTVQLGTPPRDFVIVLDSGSADFWVGSDVCKSGGGNCGNHTTLSKDSSTTFINSHTPWSIVYGAGFANGEVVQDTLVLANMVLNNYTFGIAHAIDEGTSEQPVDGLMGLGRAGLTKQRIPNQDLGPPTPVRALVNGRYIKAAITSYRLPRSSDDMDNGEITFGGLDPTKFDPTTLVTMKGRDDGVFLVPVDGVSVNGDDVGVESTLAVMDTGTTPLVVPQNVSDSIHTRIPGHELQPSGKYNIPCNTTATVALKFGGRDFPINVKDLVRVVDGQTAGQCLSGIEGFNDTTFLVGGTFLKSVYYSTNDDDNTVSLAQLV
ncbi:acid protease [Mycena filopes]|nr:acid protease [Mycena filopes]